MKRHSILGAALGLGLPLWSRCATTGDVSGLGPAPRLSLQKILQAPGGASADWEALKGKVVVVEFWATWCGPCVAAIPHLNALAEKFADKPVRFVAITDEDEAAIKSFLNKKPVRAWIGLDADRATFNAFGVTGIPRTFLVDRTGTIVADAYPTEVTENVLRDVLAGRRPSLPPRHEGRCLAAGVAPDDDSRALPLYQVLIRTSEKQSGTVARSNGRLTAEAITLRQALSIAHDLPESRIVENTPLLQDKYMIVVASPRQHQDLFQPLLQQALTTTFGLTVSRSARETDVLLLAAPHGVAAGLQAAASACGSSTQGGPGLFSAAGVEITVLVRHLDDVLGQPVVNETGLSGRFDFELKWDADQPETLPQALREQLGLELTPAKRTIEMLIVDAPPAASSPHPVAPN